MINEPKNKVVSNLWFESFEYAKISDLLSYENVSLYKDHKKNGITPFKVFKDQYQKKIYLNKEL